MILDPDQCYRALRTHDARFDGRFFVGVGTTRHLLPPGVHREDAAREELPLLPERRGRRGGRLPAVPALPARARARLRLGGRQPAPRAVRGRPDRGRRGWRTRASPTSPRRWASPTGTCAACSSRSSASRPWTTRRRSGCCSPSGCSPTRALPVARRGDGERLREPAALQRPLPHALPHDAGGAAQGRAGAARAGGPARLRPRLPPALRLARDARLPRARAPSPAWRRSTDGATGARCASRRWIARRKTGTVRAGSRSRPRRASRRCASTASASLAGAVPRAARAREVAPRPRLPPRRDRGRAGPARRGQSRACALPGAVDGFEVAVRAILGQQVTVAAATTIAGRFAQALGEPIDTPHAGLDRLFPPAARVAARHRRTIAALGIIAARARAIVALAREVDAGALRLAPSAAGRGDARGAASAARRRPLDRAVHRDARARLARRLPAPRRRRAEGDGAKPTRAVRAGARRSLAAVARLRRAAPVEIPGRDEEPTHDPIRPPQDPARHPDGHRRRRRPHRPALRRRPHAPADRARVARGPVRLARFASAPSSSPTTSRASASASTCRSRRAARRSSSACGARSRRCPSARRSATRSSRGGPGRRVPRAPPARPRAATRSSIVVPCHRIVATQWLAHRVRRRHRSARSGSSASKAPSPRSRRLRPADLGRHGRCSPPSGARRTSSCASRCRTSAPSGWSRAAPSPAASCMAAFSPRRARSPRWRRHWRGYLVMGIVGVAIPFWLIGTAVKTIDASTAAILNATSPIFSAIVAAALDPRAPHGREGGGHRDLDRGHRDPGGLDPEADERARSSSRARSRSWPARATASRASSRRCT